MDWWLIASALLGAAALVEGTTLLVAWRRRTSARRYAVRPLPPLVITAGGRSLAPAAPRRAVAGASARWSDRPVTRSVLADADVAGADAPADPSSGEAWSAVREDGWAQRRVAVDGDRAAVAHASRAATATDGSVEPATFDERTIRVQRPMEETLQFLPGRLEVTEGQDRGQSIRFVRLWGEPTVVTFGRSSGPPHRHVQLRSLTVSRLQARMRYDGRRWEITNLSETNPSLVNGEELSIHGTRALAHGDRIEMGEVVFRFWEY